MIKYALHCAADHAFEGWFGSSADYDDQAARGLLACPACGTTAVEKAVMAPAVAGTKKTAPAMPEPKVREMMMEAARQVRNHVEENFEYMGDAFADEARAIHEGRSEERGIYGEATPAEVKKLKEDGVQVAPLPDAPPRKSQVN